MKNKYITISNSNLINEITILCLKKENIKNRINDIEIVLNSICDVSLEYEIYYENKWIKPYYVIKNYLNGLR